jgi:hypothetical protein
MPQSWECGYTDEQFERLLERHALNVRIAKASPILLADQPKSKKHALTCSFQTDLGGKSVQMRARQAPTVGGDGLHIPSNFPGARSI